MNKKNRAFSNSLPVDPFTEEDKRILFSLLKSTGGKSLFPQKTAVAKKIADDICLAMEDGRIPKDFFSSKK
jgi:hypothetical protein